MQFYPINWVIAKIIVPLLFFTGIASAAGVFAQGFWSLFVIRCFVGIAEGPCCGDGLPGKNASADKRFGMNMRIVNCGVGAISTLLSHTGYTAGSAG